MSTIVLVLKHLVF